MHIANLDQASGDIAGSAATQGWTFSSGNRGTFDIIWGSFLTIFLCGWTTICVNVPATGTNWTQRLLRKCLVFCEALAGPEFIFHTALSQYLAAKKSVQKFKDAGHDGWTIRNGFLADMGGFVLHSPDFVPFPLTVDQVYYLVVHGYIDYKKVLISKEEIEDKNKFDTLTRILTTIQLLWFVVNVVARGVLGMAVTTLELSTIAFIFCTVFTCYFWRFKPQDVAAPIVVELKVPLATVLTNAGHAASRPYSYSPLDFTNDPPHYFQLVWRFSFNLAHNFGIDFHSKVRPVDKIWDDQFAHMGFKHGLILAFVQLSFAAIHFAAWRFHFPSDTERLLWHIAASYTICSMVCTWAVLYLGFEILPRVVSEADQIILPVSVSLEQPELLSWPMWLYVKLKNKFQLPCNNTIDKNPAENVPLLVVVFLIPLGVFYFMCRAYIILEDLVNIRELPSSAYDAIDWSSFLPHF